MAWGPQRARPLVHKLHMKIFAVGDTLTERLQMGEAVLQLSGGVLRTSPSNLQGPGEKSE